MTQKSSFATFMKDSHRLFDQASQRKRLFLLVSLQFQWFAYNQLIRFTFQQVKIILCVTGNQISNCPLGLKNICLKGEKNYGAANYNMMYKLEKQQLAGLRLTTKNDKTFSSLMGCMNPANKIQLKYYFRISILSEVFVLKTKMSKLQCH